MAKIVYILGLGHSGSTLLDLQLSASPDVFGLGEARMVTHPQLRNKRLEQATTKSCSCGNVMTSCPLWSDYLRRVRYQDADFNTAYAALISAFYEVHGPDAWVSDSSKDGETLRSLKELSDSDVAAIQQLRVIHLARDVRSFVASHLSRHRKQGCINAFRACRYWQTETRRHIRLLNELAIPQLTIGYEELCFFPEFTMRRIAAFLEISFTERMLAPCRSGGHVATGNPMRLDVHKSARTTYDNRWFFRTDVNVVYRWVLGLSRLNEHVVYGRTIPSLADTTFRPPVFQDHREWPKDRRHIETTSISAKEANA